MNVTTDWATQSRFSVRCVTVAESEQ
jgi:hypothetical protein